MNISCSYSIHGGVREERYCPRKEMEVKDGKKTLLERTNRIEARVDRNRRPRRSGESAIVTKSRPKSASFIGRWSNAGSKCVDFRPYTILMSLQLKRQTLKPSNEIQIGP